MKITRRQLRKLIIESFEDDFRYAEKIAGKLKEVGEDYESIRQFYELAVGIDLAQPGTLQIRDLSVIQNRIGTVVTFVAKDILKGEIMMAFDHVSSRQIPGSEYYEVTYYV